VTAAAVLAGYGVVLSAVAPGLMRRGRWAGRAPGLAIALWLALTASVLASAVLAVLTAALSASGGGGLPDLVGLCILAMHGRFPVTSQPIAVAGVLAAASVPAWVAGHLIAALWRARQECGRHARLLALVGREQGGGVVVVDDGHVAVYCLPWRPRRIVVTSAALDRFDHVQLAAVLAHESAHLAGRHHLIIAASEAIGRAFPWVPLFRCARAQIPPLVELLADDAAARDHDRATIAAALVTAVEGQVPAGALGAGELSVLARVRRLLGPPRRLPLTAWIAGTAIGAGALLAPLLVAAAAVAVLFHGHCHLT